MSEPQTDQYLPPLRETWKELEQQRIFQNRMYILPRPSRASHVGKREKRERIIDNPKAMNLLALDIATKTGFCTQTASGSWNLTPKKDESRGMRLVRFKAKLREICEMERINLSVFEQLATYGKFPNFVGAEMQGILKLFCEENNIEYRSYAPTAIKKFGTGRGNAKKDAMVEAAKKYNPSVASDDEADAIILYHLAMQDLQLTQ